MSLEFHPSFILNLLEPDMKNGKGHQSYQFHPFRLDIAERLLLRNDRKIALTPKAFGVLAYLVERSGHLVEKEELMQAIWPDSFVEESNLARIVHTLRKALSDSEKDLFIETIPKIGYRFVGEVETILVESSSNSAPIGKPENSTTRPFENYLVSARETPEKANQAGLSEPRQQIPRWVYIAIALFLVAGAVFGTRRLLRTETLTQRGSETQNRVIDQVPSDAVEEALYWTLTDAEQIGFIKDRMRFIQEIIGDEPTEVDERTLRLVKVEIDDFVQRTGSVSDRPFKEPMDKVYRRAALSSETIADYFEGVQLRAGLGIYQAMVESEYHQCLTAPNGQVGLFQLTEKTARRYDLSAEMRCKIELSADAASRYMSDIVHELGVGRSNATLALVSSNIGTDITQEYLRQLRNMRVWERSVWAIFRHGKDLSPNVPESAERYVARFFGSAITGESPTRFGLSTPALTSNRTPRSRMHSGFHESKLPGPAAQTLTFGRSYDIVAVCECRLARRRSV